MSEYESLRNEIISLEEQKRNVWIYMYVIFVTTFVLGLQLSYYLFLVEYIILIPFQVVLNRYNWCVSKISTYIRIFYEGGEKNLRWESLHVFEDFKEYDKKNNRNFFGIIRYTGAIQLGFLTTIFFIIYLLKNNYIEQQFCLNDIDILFLLVSIYLFFLILILNKEYYKDYNGELEKVMSKYKDSL